MTRRSRRELEREVDRLEDRRPDDDGAPRTPSQFVHFDGEVEVVEEGPDDEPATFDVVLTDADDEADAGAEAATDGGVDADAGDVDADEPADAEGDTETDPEGDVEADGSPINVTRMTRFHRGRLGDRGLRGGRR